MILPTFLVGLLLASNIHAQAITGTTVYVIDVGSYCSTDRALPYFLTPGNGNDFSTSEQTTQNACIAAQTFSPIFSQNVLTGGTYVVLCGNTPSAAQWQYPNFPDVQPPCSIGWTGCNPGYFNMIGWTTQVYCTGSYSNAEQFPPLTVTGSSGNPNCFPVTTCSPSVGAYFGLNNGQDPTQPTSYYVFEWNCWPSQAVGMTTLGYSAALNVHCSNFSAYFHGVGPASPGPAQSNAKGLLLSAGGIVGVLIGGTIAIAAIVLAALPAARLAALAKGKEAINRMKEMTGQV